MVGESWFQSAKIVTFRDISKKPIRTYTAARNYIIVHPNPGQNAPKSGIIKGKGILMESDLQVASYHHKKSQDFPGGESAQILRFRFSALALFTDFCISASEGRRDLIFSLN